MIKKSIILLLLIIPVGIAQQVNELYSKFNLAQSYESSGDLQNAQRLYEELFQKDPDNMQYFSALNKVYLQLKNFAASVNLLEEHLKKFPQDVNSYGLLGSTYYLMGNEQKAFEVWDEILNKPNVNPVSYRVIANYAIERRAFDKAIDIYEKGKSVSPDKIMYCFDLGRLYGITMQFKKCAEQYTEILKNDPAQYQVVEANVNQFLNKPEALQKMIPVFEDAEDENNVALIRMLAELYTQSKDFDKAYEQFVKLDEKQKSNGLELLNFAQVLYREKEYDTAAKTYEKIYSLYPGSNIVSNAKLGYAKSLEAKLFDEYTNFLPLWKPVFKPGKFESDDVTKVLNSFKEIVNLYNNSESAYEALLRIGMINLYLVGNISIAKENFEKIVRDSPSSQSSGEAYLELGNIELSNGNLEAAEQNYLQASKFNADDKTKNEATFKLARIYYFKGNNSEASQLANSLTVDLKNDFANDAIEFSIILNNAKLDSSNGILFSAAELLSDQKKFTEAAAIYKKISDNKSALLFQPMAIYRLAEMEIAEDNFTDGLNTLQQIVEEKEKNMYSDKALFLIGKIYQYGLKDDAKAIETYEKLLAEFPNSILIDEAREKIISLRNKLS